MRERHSPTVASLPGLGSWGLNRAGRRNDDLRAVDRAVS